MILKNPTKEAVSINYQGQEYTIEAEGTSSNLPADVAMFWITKIHGFLQVLSSKAETAEAVTVVETKAQTKARLAKEAKAAKEAAEAEALTEEVVETTETEDSEATEETDEDDVSEEVIEE